MEINTQSVSGKASNRKLMARFEPEVRAAALRRDLAQTRQLYTPVTPKIEAAVRTLENVERREWLKAAIKTGVRIPLKYFLWVGLAFEVALWLYEHQDDLNNMWVQGPWDMRCYASGTPYGDANNASQNGWYSGLLYNICPTSLQAVTPANKITAFTVPGTVTFMSNMIYTDPQIDRYTAIHSMFRRTGFTGTVVRPHWAPAIRIPLLANPAWDPLEAPIYQPRPVDKPVWLTPAQKRDKDEYIETISPVPSPPTVVVMPVRPGSYDPQSIPLDSVQPMSTEISAGGRKDLPPRYVSAPPRSGEKERKFILAPHQKSPAGIAMNIATESSDFIDAVFFAIPRAIRPKWPDGKNKKLSMTAKLRFIYDHYEEVNASRMFNNLLQNQVQDTIGGIRGRLNAKANRAGGFATGLRQIKFN